jgi:outer membrane lipoprotein-sorting protein
MANIEFADLDGDGDLDYVTGAAHTHGVWYYEQTAFEKGSPVFQRHDIDDSFSQVHAVLLADIDGDGGQDLIAGKRFWAHNNTDTDPGANDPAVLYWYETKRTEAGKMEFVRHLVDDNSGVGLQIVAVDLDKNNKLDIVVSNKKGVHVFTQ